mmetsp:Transcript_79705/g.231371  ORF Transcript_79705/g.231371 Transcript_79705/m.231371 type:complete len:318 (-) Transcript_79705:843-1796(-)
MIHAWQRAAQRLRPQVLHGQDLGPHAVVPPVNIGQGRRDLGAPTSELVKLQEDAMQWAQVAHSGSAPPHRAGTPNLGSRSATSRHGGSMLLDGSAEDCPALFVPDADEGEGGRSAALLVADDLRHHAAQRVVQQAAPRKAQQRGEASGSRSRAQQGARDGVRAHTGQMKDELGDLQDRRRAPKPDRRNTVAASTGGATLSRTPALRHPPQLLDEADDRALQDLRSLAVVRPSPLLHEAPQVLVLLGERHERLGDAPGRSAGRRPRGVRVLARSRLLLAIVGLHKTTLALSVRLRPPWLPAIAPRLRVVGRLVPTVRP